MELDLLPEQVNQRIEEIGSAELVVGMPTSSPDQIGGVIDTIRNSLSTAQVASLTLVIPAEALAPDEWSRAAEQTDGPLRFVPLMASLAGRLPALADRLSDVYRAVFAIGRRLDSKACAVIGSDLEAFNPDWICRLVQPVMEKNFDLVLPSYARQRFDGLLTSSVLYPLTSALYGKRIRWPLAADLGLSARMMDSFLTPDPRAIASGRRGPPTWMTTAAVCGDFEVCETQVDLRVPATREPTDLSTSISYVLGPLFLDMEYHASYWQQIRNSQPVPVFGRGAAHPEGADEVDIRPMVDGFQLAFGNLQEVWGLVLPPATLLELKKLTRQPLDKFRLADQWWARIVYDFALAHRLRVLNRDQLLRALTPLYRAWLASYALEVQSLHAADVERRLERLCLAYESEKSYLVSRWRWPDRFSP